MACRRRCGGWWPPGCCRSGPGGTGARDGDDGTGQDDSGGTGTGGTGCLRSSYTIALDTGAIPLQHEVETLARCATIELQGFPPSQDAHSVPLVLQALTGREREVLNQLASGLTNRQIAERLYISPRTAAVHVSSVLHKLGVPDRIQAAHLARKLQDQESRGSATSPEPGT